MYLFRECGSAVRELHASVSRRDFSCGVTFWGIWRVHKRKSKGINGDVFFSQKIKSRYFGAGYFSDRVTRDSTAARGAAAEAGRILSDFAAMGRWASEAIGDAAGDIA